ncbi:hypothetical protein EV361DRAFT_788225 [Lentinula raphanica]|nr:hypothetical protein EV361DRAFT_788225 [Lentinula raphanica]
MGDNPNLEAENRSEDGNGGEAVISSAGVGDASPEEQIQAVPQTPIVSVCFLMISGKRRMMTFEPETTVGRVKELVWNTWPAGPDWQEERPSTPSHLRILHLGKVLQDEETLQACNFPIYTPTASSPSLFPPYPTIVHLAVRPAGPGSSEFGDRGDLEKKKNRSARTRLVARFSSVLAGADGADEPSVSPTQATLTSPGESSTSPQRSANDAHGCTCCIVC